MQAAFSAVSSPPQGVYLNLNFSASMDFEANGDAVRSWPDEAVVNPSVGEQTHSGIFDENDLKDASPASFASPYDQVRKE